MTVVMRGVCSVGGLLFDIFVGESLLGCGCRRRGWRRTVGILSSCSQMIAIGLDAEQV